MSDLFPDLEEHLSPDEAARREFCECMGVSLRHTPQAYSKPYHAHINGWKAYYMEPSIEPRRNHARAQTQTAAIEELAAQLGVDLYREGVQ